MWAQQWGNIYSLLAPASFGRGVDITPLLKAKKATAVDMAKYAEGFFVSLGLQKLPATFWERSLLTRPRDREVVCHASAWSLDYANDVRIKMCTNVTGEDFVVLHHEMGHNYYQLAYNQQPYLFQDSANDGFHEAIGDAVALSITPAYLQKVGLLGSASAGRADLGPLMYTALEKIAFLPFGLLIDQWRWKVFNGEVKPEAYNSAWWELREKYQGVKAPVARSNDDFDPGAKYHIPGNTPYMRYFLAHVLQFQIHRALCREAGYQGPLHECSVYGNTQAGEKLQRMLAMGLSRPWPDALEALSGERQLDASAMVEYFQPLLSWLEEQNKGVPTGW
jgi:peptidyl-dipeptidase A